MTGRFSQKETKVLGISGYNLVMISPLFVSGTPRGDFMFSNYNPFNVLAAISFLENPLKEIHCHAVMVSNTMKFHLL